MKAGCCADGSCTPANCMLLPDGMTCADCKHFRRCAQLFGCNEQSRRCDWWPRRFATEGEG